jgi:hypothetical protein
MPAAIKPSKLFTVRYEVTGDEVCDAEPWNVIAPDGETYESCFETEGEALAYAKECNDSLAEEAEAAEEAEREELVAALQAHVEDMGLKELRKLAKRLGLSVE